MLWKNENVDSGGVLSTMQDTRPRWQQVFLRMKIHPGVGSEARHFKGWLAVRCKHRPQSVILVLGKG